MAIFLYNEHHPSYNNMFPDTPSPTESTSALADPEGTPAWSVACRLRGVGNTKR